MTHCAVAWWGGPPGPQPTPGRLFVLTELLRYDVLSDEGPPARLLTLRNRLWQTVSVKLESVLPLGFRPAGDFESAVVDLSLKR
jgi:hypothetical protein